MESTSRNLVKDSGEEENPVVYAIESLGSKRCKRNQEIEKTLILSSRRSSCRELFLHNIHGSYTSIPKHITTIDEKYVLRCLELIRNCALRAASWNFTSKVDTIADHTNSTLANIKNRSLNSMAIEYPLGGGTEVVVSSTGDWTIGTVSGSQTMINILKSPLLQQFGSFDGVSEPQYEPTMTVSHKVQKDVKVLNHKRDTSISSSNSSLSDHSSASGYGSSFQGMLQCAWKGGLPHHVFTVDDKREVYVAKLSKVDSSNDYSYTFHLRRNGKKDSDNTELELETVAKMLVSTSTSFPSSGLEVKETKFVLTVFSDSRTGEMQTSNQTIKKNKRLTRKVVDVFRSGHSHKHRSPSILEGSNGIDQSEDVHNSFLDQDECCAENKHAANHELAAIIVKEVCKNRKEAELGGWGLKFLKKPGSNVMPSEHSRSTGECSTSMDVVIPAGFHGGPRTRVGGPSSLIERWASGGSCDCGGWDIGCPLTVLNTRSTSSEYSSWADNSGECKSIDFYMQGSKPNVSIMKMVNIHKDLYYIHFQSTLSTLQSFAIAAAIIHSHSGVLGSKVYRS